MKKWILLFVVIVCLGFSSKPVIVFDFGGVMIDFDRPQMINWCCDSLSIELDQIRAQRGRINGELAIGAVEEGEFWQSVAEENGVVFPQEWKKNFMESINRCKNRREEMFDLVRALRSSGYRVALFSDVTQWQAETFRTAGDYVLFSPVVLSCEIGARKPNSESYAKLFNRLGVEAKECIFIDDRAENIEGARKAGMRAILFKTPGELKESLLGLGVQWTADKYVKSEID